MPAVEITLWLLLALAIGAVLIGFGFGALAAWPRDPRPERPAALPPRELSRAGYLPMYPDHEPGDDDDPTGITRLGDWPETITMSELSAGWDQLERNVSAMTAPLRKYGG